MDEHPCSQASWASMRHGWLSARAAWMDVHHGWSSPRAAWSPRHPCSQASWASEHLLLPDMKCGLNTERWVDMGAAGRACAQRVALWELQGGLCAQKGGCLWDLQGGPAL